VNVLCFVEDDELSAQAVGFARTLGDVRAVTFAGAYQPAAWAKALAAQDADAIVAAGSDRGNELLAHVGAILDRPFAANVIALDGDTVTRVRWGGSLLEEARLHGAPQLLTVAPHTQPAADIGEVETLDAPDDGSPKVLERVEESSGGVSLRDAKVVVSGGRGVGPSEHIAGAKGAKKILAINTDPEAPIFASADYAVIGDLHEVVPAISAELRKVRG
jgi:electron transfer flavoprotein alpha subunit